MACAALSVEKSSKMEGGKLIPPTLQETSRMNRLQRMAGTKLNALKELFPKTLKLKMKREAFLVEGLKYFFNSIRRWLRRHRLNHEGGGKWK